MQRNTRPCRDREKKALSWSPVHSSSLRAQRQLKRISSSLDLLQDNLLSEHIKITRDLEKNVNRVNDSVQCDINDVKARVTALEKWIIFKCRKSYNATNFNNLIPDNLRLDRKVGTPWSVPSNSNQFRKASSLDALDEHRKSSLHLDWDNMNSGQSDVRQPGLSKRGRLKKTSASEEVLHSKCDLAFSHQSVSENELDALLNLQLLLGDLNDDWKAELKQYMTNGWYLPGSEKEQEEKFKSRISKFQAFRQEVFLAHNCYRRFHNCKELFLADDLTRHAQEWANDLACKGYPLYSELTDRGENVVTIHIPDETNLSGFEVCSQWYEEGKRFNFSTPKWQRGTRNFTQMIWKSSTEIGIGIAKVQGQNRYILVVHYKPPGNGNMPGEFSQNITPPLPLK